MSTLVWVDCHPIDQCSWFGKPPQLRQVDIPFSRPKVQCPPSFAVAFNSTGEAALRSAFSEKLIPSMEPHHVSPFLFFCDGIRPQAVSQYFLQKMSDAQTLFYYYFSAANLDYLALPDAMRLLLSRVAYPEDQKSLFAIFCAFADAYAEANSYISETREEICKLAIAAVVLSMSKRKASGDCLAPPRFLQLVEQVRCSQDFKTHLYEAIRERPIVLYFTSFHFSADPEISKKGVLTKPRTLFNKKRLFCLLQDQSLKIYNDQGCTDQSEEVPLYNVTVKFAPAKDKEPAMIVISSKDGLPFGSSFQKNQRRPGKKAVYEFSGAKDEQELKTWVDTFNFVAFYLQLIQMTNMSSKCD
jgi:hypothetical protein